MQQKNFEAIHSPLNKCVSLRVTRSITTVLRKYRIHALSCDDRQDDVGIRCENDPRVGKSSGSRRESDVKVIRSSGGRREFDANVI